VNSPPSIAMFGSSLVSAYWNGAATYYRGILRELAARGCDVDFYEPNAYDRQAHRDIPDPPYARVHIYEPTPEAAHSALAEARSADIVVKASGVGVLDDFLEAQIARLSGPCLRIFWDVDAPATLERMSADRDDPFHAILPAYDMVLTYGGGQPVIREYRRLGARSCVPVYNALDPTTHFPVAPDARFTGDLGFLGNRLPDREQRVHDFFFAAARRMPERQFVLGGSGWGEGVALPANVRYVGHVYTRDHNAFNCSPRAVININRQSMARFGFSPPTRVFEAAGAGACLLCDRWEGIEQFLTPGKEVLVVDSGEEVAAVLAALDGGRAHAIGTAARARVLAEHSYARRADQLMQLFDRQLGPAKAVRGEARAHG
jgi:spore maturation protein CgeB